MSHKIPLEHHSTVKEEILCHFPYAIFSIVLSMIMVSLITVSSLGSAKLYDLFHLFHYLHLVFSATGVVLTFRRFSRNFFGAFLAGIFVPALFCTLSDMIVPYIGGRCIGLDVHFHWCFFEHFWAVIPFLAIGLINGMIMGSHTNSQKLFYSTGSHFAHILVSSMASILFLVSAGFAEWHGQLAAVFMILIIAVLLPCTLSDIVVPMIFARLHGEKEFDSGGCCLTTDANKMKHCNGGTKHENDSY